MQVCAACFIVQQSHRSPVAERCHVTQESRDVTPCHVISDRLEQQEALVGLTSEIGRLSVADQTQCVSSIFIIYLLVLCRSASDRSRGSRVHCGRPNWLDLSSSAHLRLTLRGDLI